MSSQSPPAPERIVWSASHVGPVDAAHLKYVIDRAADEGVDGFEIAGHATDLHRFVDLGGQPAAAGAESCEARRVLAEIADHAKRRGLRLGIWHHEISGPPDLLDRMPELRAADGLINLDSPRLYNYLRDKAAAFFRDFPQFDELVLTLTETGFPVTHRPFCAVPPAERVRRVLQAVADATEAADRTLVVRPFSAVRADELFVREAVEQLRAQRVELMYKTEPFDWHPFLPDEPLIGSVVRYPARAEADAGAEYYGQSVFPVCYARHLESRLTAALNKGASTAVLRVDRGADHPSLDAPVNEVNIIAATRWLRAPNTPIDEHVRNWIAQVHDCDDPRLADLFHRTFDVIKGALYVDGHALSNARFPTLDHAKHIQVFALFEPGVSLDHLCENWGMLHDRKSPSHEAILAEKDQAASLAESLRSELDAALPCVREANRAPVAAAFDRLVLLARACRQLCRLIAAHAADAWALPQQTAGFEAEGRAMLALADELDRAFPPPLFPAKAQRQPEMSQTMRQWVSGLREERQVELPRRAALCRERDLVSYVLCGFAAEGRRPRKRLHSGAAPRVGDDYARRSGLGQAEGFGYRLPAMPGRPHRLSIDLLGEDKAIEARITVGDVPHAIRTGAFRGVTTQTIDLPAAPSEAVDIFIWSEGPHPVTATELRLYADGGTKETT